MEPAPHVSGGGGTDDAPPPSQPQQVQRPQLGEPQKPSRYESQKRRDWNTFLQFLANQKPPLTLARCGGVQVVEFLEYLDQFGKTKVHAPECSFFGHAQPAGPCQCPTKQAWGSLDALIGRLRAAYEENGGRPEANPFGDRAVKSHLREVRASQAKARGVPYEKKRKRHTPAAAANERGSTDASASTAAVGAGSSSAVRDPPAGSLTSGS